MERKRCNRWDHPRVCGEQLQKELDVQKEVGSPPRVRGTDIDGIRSCGTNRITPACAGNRRTAPRRTGTEPDHPRVCGEQFFLNGVFQKMKGSPPRVRGTGFCKIGLPPRLGITPACAGNRHCSCSRRVHQGDHPRVCGEQGTQHGCRARFVGSPPRVRGTATQSLYIGYYDRITPACAGNSFLFFRRK